MLFRLVHAMAARPWAVIIAVLVLSIAAAARVAQTPLEVFPEFVSPQVTVQTEAPGLTAEQVEQLVTRPVEAAVNGATGLESLRSDSIPGLSVVILAFQDDVDAARTRQGVAERLAELQGHLPDGVGSPTMSPLTSSTMDLLKIGLVSTQATPYELRDLADWTLKPRLLAIPGAARVTVFGGEVRQLQVTSDPSTLRNLGLTLEDLAVASRRAIAVRGGGFVDTGEQRLDIQPSSAPITPQQLAQAFVARRGSTALRLSDVATVDYGPAIKVGDALIQGKPGVLITISGQYGANTLEVTKSIEDVLHDLAPILASKNVELFPALHRPASFIERALRNLVFALLVGGALILLVLIAFLKNWRPALISFVTIPVSLLLSAAVLALFGYRLDTMVLGGFAVASGVLVDDAIIDVENVLRRLRQLGAAADTAAILETVAQASVEIRVAVFYGTAVALLVFVPIIAMTGVQGRFLAPLGIAFSAAVLMSLVVASTLTPALCTLMLRSELTHQPPRWLDWVARLHGRLVARMHRVFWPGVLVLAATLGLVVTIAIRLESDFLPQFREGHFVVQLTSMQPGTSLKPMLAIGRGISQQMLALPYVATVEQQVGRAERAEDTWGTYRSELHVELKEDVPIDQAQAERHLRAIVESYPGLHSEVLTFLGDRISETLTGETAQAVIQVVGDDLDVIERVGARLAGVVSHVSGAVDVQVKRASGAPQLSVALDRARIARAGLDADAVLTNIERAYSGAAVGQVYEGSRAVDVVVLAPHQWRERLFALQHLPITLPSGQSLPLSQLASVGLAEGRASIHHESGRRSVAVTFNAEDRSAASVVADVRAAIAHDLALPKNVALEFTGVAEADRAAKRRLMLHGALVVFAVLLVLSLGFRYRRHPWIVLLNLPFALLGSIAAIELTGVGLSLGALVGVITVFGISARNAIMLLSHYEHLVHVEDADWSEPTMLRGARERLVPVLMTAAVTGMGLLPLAVGASLPGYELEGPLAIAVLGGLVSSTLLSLLMLPEVTRRFGMR